MLDLVINYGGLFDSVNHKELDVFETIMCFHSLVLTTDSGKTIYLCLTGNPKVAQDSILIVTITLEIKAPKESQAFLLELCSILFLGPP